MLDKNLADPSGATMSMCIAARPTHRGWPSRLLAPRPAGGGYSPVKDLLQFTQALREHRLLRPAMTATVRAWIIHGGRSERRGAALAFSAHARYPAACMFGSMSRKIQTSETLIEVAMIRLLVAHLGTRDVMMY
jgi:hypothetical protein